MNDLWNEEESTVLAGLKRHLVRPCDIPVTKETCYLIQEKMFQTKSDTFLTELWDWPIYRWFSEQSSPRLGAIPVWRLELIQTLSSIFSGKVVDFRNPLFFSVNKYLFHMEEDNALPRLLQPFPGHPLKELALEGDAVQCKFFLDLAKNPEKKLHSVLQIMLNQGHFQAAADLHNLCGKGLEKIDRDLLFSIWSNTGKEKVSEDFDRIVMPLLMPRDLLLTQHPTGKWDKRMQVTLETGCADGNTVIFMDGDCKMTLGKYMHFLYEIREGLLKIDIGDKLKSDVHASEIFMEWENCKVFR